MLHKATQRVIECIRGPTKCGAKTCGDRQGDGARACVSRTRTWVSEAGTGHSTGGGRGQGAPQEEVEEGAGEGMQKDTSLQ